MSQAIATFLGKRFLGDQVGNYFAQDDPYFEATHDTPGGKKTKPKIKALPPGLSEHDAKILKKVRNRAYHLDRSLPCCCCSFRFGWSAVIGIIPIVGDLIDMFFAYHLIQTCLKVGLPSHIVGQMYANMAVDFGIGLIPVIGDIADAWFKCNTRNNVLLERFLREKGQKHPAAPPPQKQSGLRRWFGSGADDPAKQPPPHETAVETQAASMVPVTTTHQSSHTYTHATGAIGATSAMGAKPPLPDRTASAVKAGMARSGGHDYDLEAQHDSSGIHYRREA